MRLCDVYHSKDKMTVKLPQTKLSAPVERMVIAMRVRKWSGSPHGIQDQINSDSEGAMTRMVTMTVTEATMTTH